MSWKNRVIWSEGLLLKPQHFQQHDRYLEAFIEGRSRALRSHSWGFSLLELDEDQLAIGKLAIARARGVFPDGTPFDIPAVDPAPAPVDIDGSVRETRAYLGIPVRRQEEREVADSVTTEGLARYVAHEISARDVSDFGSANADMRVGSLRTRVLIGEEHREDYACLGLAHIQEAKADRTVVVNRNYVPPALDIECAPFLSGFARELQGLVHHRAEELAGRVTMAGQDGTAGIAEFLLLQALNRFEPVITHIAATGGMHPETFYRTLLGVAGDLSTFDESRRPREFPPYDHDELMPCFDAVMHSLRESLGKHIEPNAVRIPLKEPRFGIRAGLVQDTTLLSTADFVLAVRADMPLEDLRKHFPPQAKIGSVNNIKQLIESGVPGIPLQALSVAPRQIKYYSDFVYFQLASGGDHWPAAGQSAGFAVYVGGEFPGLDMQFWAIRRQ